MQWLYDDDDVERMAAAGFEEGGERGRHGEEEQAGRRKRGERERGDRDGGCPINFQLDWLGGAQRRREKET